MPRTRYRVALLAVVALAAAVSAFRFVGGSEASTGDRAALPAAATAAESTPAAPMVSLGADQTTEQIPLDQTPTVDSAPSPVLHATLSPNDGEVVGVGMPAVVTFDRPVAAADRPAVEERLAVSANPPVEGAWRWIGPARVHWRPAVYWAPGTQVTLHSDLRGLEIGDVSGAEERTIHFRIGAAHVSTIDANTHQMTVTADGQVVNVFPVSLGQKRYPTHNGVHLTLEKSRQVTMDSTTIGIPRNGPGGYYRKVAWATRLSYSGTFVHAAPWSVWAQGKQNVSHGCVNAGTADAKWFYDFTQRGDVVEVVNSPAKPKLYDPGMSEWNLTWEQWRSGDTA
jgi:lipoprotein-anchoring transpeptidase ErfK/SrfK